MLLSASLRLYGGIQHRGAGFMVCGCVVLLHLSEMRDAKQRLVLACSLVFLLCFLPLTAPLGACLWLFVLRLFELFLPLTS